MQGIPGQERAGLSKRAGTGHWRSEKILSPCFLCLSLPGCQKLQNFTLESRPQRGLSPISILLRKGMGGPRQGQLPTSDRNRARVHQMSIRLEVKKIIFRKE